MVQIDIHGLRWNDVFMQAAAFRLQPADPASDGTITITREVFDRLVAVVEAASVANALPLTCQKLVARRQDDKHVVELCSGAVGNIKEEGRTLLEAIAKAVRSLDHSIERSMA